MLAIRRKNNHVWEFPKGRRLSKTESVVRTAIREFREETGIQAPYIPSELGYHTYPTRYEDKKMVVWFWLHVEEDVSDQIWYREARTEDIRWFTTSQLCNSFNKFKGSDRVKELAVKALGFANKRTIISRLT